MAVRSEVVRLSLQDDFTSGMARAAAAAALLNRELDSLSGSAVSTSRAQQDITRDNDEIAKSANRADSSINQLTGRLRLFADIAAILGPSLAPIGAVGIAGIAGLTNQLGAAAVAGGVAIAAFQGIGTALTAVNKAALEPTDANIQKAKLAMEQLSPVAQDLVVKLQGLRPVMMGLRDVAAEGLFPGVMEALNDLESRIPDVANILSNVSEALGDIASDSAASLTTARWDDFFDFLANDVPDTIRSLARTVGDLTHGMAELWMAFTPLNDDFSGWLEGVARGFDAWASGLDQTEGFRDFIAYVRESGPQVAETFGALGNAILQIVKASAPLGGPVLNALEDVADVLAAIAGSEIGTPLFAAAGAFALWNRASSAWVGISGAVTSGLERVGTSSKTSTGLLTGLNKGLTAVAASYITLKAANEALHFDETDGDIRRMIASLGEGTGLRGEIKATSDALREQQRIMDEARGLNLGVFKLWSTDDADDAAAKAAQLEEHLKDLQAQAGPTSRELGGLASLLGGSLAPAVGLTAAEFEGAARSAEDFAREMTRLSGFLDKREALRNYQQALDDFSQSIKDNGKSFDTANEKGRANQKALDGIASAALQAAEHLRGLNKVRTLTRAADDIRALGKQLGIPPKLIQVVIDKLKQAARTDAKPEVKPQGIPQANRDVDGVQGKFNFLDRFTANPDMQAKDHASGPIGWVQSALDNLDGDNATVTITTIRETINRITTFEDFIPFRSADGGTVPGMAGGGTIGGPRLPYGDKVLMYLAPGEEVISNRYGQADRYRDILKAINANAYANGGTVRSAMSAPRVSVSTGPLSATTSLSDRDVQRIAAAVQAGAREGTAKGMDARTRVLTKNRRTGG